MIEIEKCSLAQTEKYSLELMLHNDLSEVALVDLAQFRKLDQPVHLQEHSDSRAHVMQIHGIEHESPRFSNELQNIRALPELVLNQTQALHLVV